MTLLDNDTIAAPATAAGGALCLREVLQSCKRFFKQRVHERGLFAAICLQ